MIGPHSDADFENIEAAGAFESSEVPQIWLHLVAQTRLAFEPGGQRVALGIDLATGHRLPEETNVLFALLLAVERVRHSERIPPVSSAKKSRPLLKEPVRGGGDRMSILRRSMWMSE
jgi:hypothetical protein